MTQVHTGIAVGEVLNQDLDSCQTLDKRYGSTHTCSTDVKTPVSSKMHTSYDVYALTPLVLPSTTATSSPPSSRKGDPVWDPPETPVRQSFQVASELAGSWTCPTTSPRTLKVSVSAAESIHTTPCRKDSDRSIAKKQNQNNPGSDFKVRDFNTMIRSAAADSSELSSNCKEDFHLDSDIKEDNVFGDSRKVRDNNIDVATEPKLEAVVSQRHIETLNSTAIPSQRLSKQTRNPGSILRYPLAVTTNVQADSGSKAETIFSAIDRRSRRTALGVSQTLLPQEAAVEKFELLAQPLPQLHFKYQHRMFNFNPSQIDVADRMLLVIDQNTAQRMTHSTRVDLSFNFGLNSILKKSVSRPSKSTVPQTKAQSHEDHLIEVVKPEPRKMFYDLRNVFEHIIPHGFTDRIKNDPKHCVATSARKKRCSRGIEEKGDVTKAIINDISQCIENLDYSAIPNHFEELVKQTTCKTHQNVAFTQSIARPRMQTLRDLIVCLAHVQDKNLKTLEIWLASVINRHTVSLDVRAGTLLHPKLHMTSLSEILDQIIPAQMHIRIQNNPRLCVMSNCLEKHPRSHFIRGERKCLVTAKSAAIAQCIKRSDYEAIPDHISDLGMVVMCSNHQPVASWKKDLLNRIARNFAHISRRHVSAFSKWINAVANCDSPLVPHAVKSTSSSSQGAKVQRESRTTKGVTSNTAPSYPPDFSTYHASLNTGDDIAKALKATVHRKLSKKDEEDGFVYMFWDQQHFGMVKIGRTNNPERRLKEWNNQCHATHHYHMSSQGDGFQEIPHVQRIEKLVHIELGNYRRERKCTGCGKKHIEWFDINEAKARQVYEKWRDWIVQRPYAQDSTGKWRIRPEMLDTVAEVCQPVVFTDSNVKDVRPRKPRAKPDVKRRTSRKTI